VTAVVLDSLNKLGPALTGLIGSFALASVGVMVWQWLRFERHRRRRDRLRGLDRNSQPRADPELQKYLHPTRDRVDIDEDHRFLLCMVRRDMLADLARRSKPLRLGPLFTGCALFLTFILIGYVLVTDMQAALEAFSQSGTSVGSGAQDALDQASRRLAQGVGGLGGKFFISAAGVLFSVVYTIGELLLEARHRRMIDEMDHALRSVFASPEEYDGLLQRRHLDVLGEISHKVGCLNNIQVSVQNLSSEVVHQLSQVLTKDLGEQMHGMMAQALERVDSIATRTNEALSADLRQVMNVAQEGIPHVVQHLEAIRNEVAHQAKAPVEELVRQFKTALTGGFQHESAQLGAALNQFAMVVPEMARSLEAVGRSMTDSVSAGQERSQAIQQQLLSEMARVLEHLERQQTGMGQLVGRIHGEALETATSLGSKLQEQLDAAAAGFAAATATQTGAMNDRVAAVLSTQQTAFAELETKVGGVVEALGQADRALASSARHLETSAQHLGVAHETAHRVVSGATSVVAAVNNSARVLNESATHSQEFLEQAKRIVHAAMEHADKEAELTRQLQAVWPGLFDRYLQSFQQKSDALASSWEQTHQRVVSITKSVADDLQTPIDELRDTVNVLAETLKARPSR
jgi:hypothetical protein